MSINSKISPQALNIMGDYNIYTDEELLSGMKEGDEKAFTTLYNRYWKRTFYLIAKKLGNAAIAEELVQDIFTDIWIRRHVIGIRGSFAAYLSVAVKYKVINIQAKQYRDLCYKKYQGYTQIKAANTAEQYLSFEELRERLAQELALLPEKCRLSFKLCKEEGFSQKEAAMQMHITPKAVERNIARAIKSLAVSMRHFLSFFIF